MKKVIQIGERRLKKKMVQKNVSLGMVVVVALIVSVVASVATLAITGNTVNVASGNAGVVYTKTEVDSMIKNAVLSFYKKTEIDSMFGNYYPKSQVESLIASAIANFYTKTEIDQKLAEVSGGGGTATNSKACDADGVCEVNALSSINGTKYLKITNESYGMKILEISDGASTTKTRLSSGSLWFMYGNSIKTFISTNQIKVGSDSTYTTMDSYTGISTPALAIRNLQTPNPSNVTQFVCVDSSTGNLYKKATPCA